jgi:exopolyphosphatase / guanosine-5'-triphosphate,3'-diphosphate pyrophosphatase
MRIAVIAAGTNSCRLLIVRRDDAGLYIEHHDIRGTRLGEGLTAGAALNPDAARRTLAAMAEFAQLAKRADKLVVIGTHALREASDAAAFARSARESTGTELRVLTGAEEARASFAGALWALERIGTMPDAVSVIDIGGGSTELAVRKDRASAVHVTSLPIGAVRLTERFFKHDPPLASELTACRTAVRLELDGMDRTAMPGGVICAVGGTADTAARMLNAYDPAAEVHVATARLDDIVDLLRLTSALPLDARKRLHGLPESRADIFPAGLIVLEEIARRANVREILVTEADLLIGFVSQGIGA